MSGQKVFVSYCSKQGEWVWDRLVPCLKAGGADVLIDRERFGVGTALYRQMDDTQDTAERQVLVLSNDYLASAPCRHEMDRAVALDPDFERGIVIPALREDCPIPPEIAKPNSLYADLRDDKAAPPWDKLLQACGADLGTEAPHWLEVRDEVRRYLRREQSVNLVVQGKPKWRELIADLSSAHDPKGPINELALVDLQNGEAASRQGLVSAIIRALGGNGKVPPPPNDLGVLARFIEGRPKFYLGLLHFDYVAHRPHYGVDFFGALRNLVSDQRKLVLLLESRESVQTLLPHDHPMLSEFNSLQTAELKGRP